MYESVGIPSYEILRSEAKIVVTSTPFVTWALCKSVKARNVTLNNNVTLRLASSSTMLHGRIVRHHGRGPSWSVPGVPDDPLLRGVGVRLLGVGAHDLARVPAVQVPPVLLARREQQTILRTLCM